MTFLRSFRHMDTKLDNIFKNEAPNYSLFLLVETRPDANSGSVGGLLHIVYATCRWIMDNTDIC